jgi:hypothetical protein
MRNLKTFCLSAALWSMQTNAQQPLSNEDLALARQIEATAIQELKSQGAARATITNEELPSLNNDGPAGKIGSHRGQPHSRRAAGRNRTSQSLTIRLRYGFDLQHGRRSRGEGSRGDQSRGERSHPPRTGRNSPRRGDRRANGTANPVRVSGATSNFADPRYRSAKHNLRTPACREGAASSPRGLVDLSMEAVAKARF